VSVLVILLFNYDNFEIYKPITILYKLLHIYHSGNYMFKEIDVKYENQIHFRGRGVCA